MKTSGQQNGPSLWLWLLVAVCGLIGICALFPARSRTPLAAPASSTNETYGDRSASRKPAQSSSPREREAPAFQPTAAEIVAGKLARFAQSRRSLARALAQRHNAEVPPQAERFFDAVESGDWDRIEAAFKIINGGDSSAGHADSRPPGVQALWPAIIDAYGAAEQVHAWPPQKLLDYGNTILGSLTPGMVYVGGTDNGRWIPELLNETSEGEKHMVVTQNALADGSYLDYLRLQYDDRLSNLTEDESQRAFQQYIDDARKRLAHDQQFPNEPKQVRPGEDIQLTDGKIQVGGQVAVMSINERLLQMLMDKNPELPFALQESFPLKGTYADAMPLGPLMELRAQGGSAAFSPDQASQSAAFWQSTAQQLLADPEATSSPATLKSWSHDINSAANLLAAHGYSADAEQTYRLSTQLWPGNPEPVAALADLLGQSGRLDQARVLLENFDRQFPDQRSHLETTGAWKLIMGK